MECAVAEPAAPAEGGGDGGSSSTSPGPANFAEDEAAADDLNALIDAEGGRGGAAGARREALKKAFDELQFPPYPSNVAGSEVPFNLPKVRRRRVFAPPRPSQDRRATHPRLPPAATLTVGAPPRAQGYIDAQSPLSAR